MWSKKFDPRFEENETSSTHNLTVKVKSRRCADREDNSTEQRRCRKTVGIEERS